MQPLFFLGILLIGSIILYVLLTPKKVKVGELVDGPRVLTLYKVGTAYKAWTGLDYIPIKKEFSICNERLCPLKQGEQVLVAGKKYTVQL
jgi:hypothetical protein